MMVECEKDNLLSWASNRFPCSDLGLGSAVSSIRATSTSKVGSRFCPPLLGLNAIHGSRRFLNNSCQPHMPNSHHFSTTYHPIILFILPCGIDISTIRINTCKINPTLTTYQVNDGKTFNRLNMCYSLLLFFLLLTRNFVVVLKVLVAETIGTNKSTPFSIANSVHLVKCISGSYL